MRQPLALLVALAIAAPALAQPVLDDSSTVYLSPVLGVAHQGSMGTAFVLGGDIGWRLGRHSDVGVRVLTGDLSFQDGNGGFLTVGPTAGISGRTPSGFELDARVIGTATFADLGRASDLDGFGLQVLRGTAQVTASRAIPIVGSLRLAPTLGLYGTACSTVGYDRTGPDGRCAEAGVLGGVDLRFRVLGADVSMPIIARLASVGNDFDGRLGVFDLPQAPIQSGIRIRF